MNRRLQIIENWDCIVTIYIHLYKGTSLKKQKSIEQKNKHKNITSLNYEILRQ